MRVPLLMASAVVLSFAQAVKVKYKNQDIEVPSKIPVDINSMGECVRGCYAMAQTQDGCNDIACHCKNYQKTFEWVRSCALATSKCELKSIDEFVALFTNTCKSLGDGKADAASGKPPGTSAATPPSRMPIGHTVVATPKPPPPTAPPPPPPRSTTTPPATHPTQFEPLSSFAGNSAPDNHNVKRCETKVDHGTSIFVCNGATRMVLPPQTAAPYQRTKLWQYPAMTAGDLVVDGNQNAAAVPNKAQAPATAKPTPKSTPKPGPKPGPSVAPASAKPAAPAPSAAPANTDPKKLKPDEGAKMKPGAQPSANKAAKPPAKPPANANANKAVSAATAPPKTTAKPKLLVNPPGRLAASVVKAPPLTTTQKQKPKRALEARAPLPAVPTYSDCEAYYASKTTAPAAAGVKKAAAASAWSSAKAAAAAIAKQTLSTASKRTHRPTPTPLAKAAKPANARVAATSKLSASLLSKRTHRPTPTPPAKAMHAIARAMSVTTTQTIAASASTGLAAGNATHYGMGHYRHVKPSGCSCKSGHATGKAHHTRLTTLVVPVTTTVLSTGAAAVSPANNATSGALVSTLVVATMTTTIMTTTVVSLSPALNAAAATPLGLVTPVPLSGGPSNATTSAPAASNTTVVVPVLTTIYYATPISSLPSASDTLAALPNGTAPFTSPAPTRTPNPLIATSDSSRARVATSDVGLTVAGCVVAAAFLGRDPGMLLFGLTLAVLFKARAILGFVLGLVELALLLWLLGAVLAFVAFVVVALLASRGVDPCVERLDVGGVTYCRTPWGRVVITGKWGTVSF